MPKTRRIVKEGGEAALALLRLTVAAADAFPPLKSAASGALYIVDIVKKFKSNTKDWEEFGQFIQNAVACIIQHLPTTDQPPSDLKMNVEGLQLVLDEIQSEIQTLQETQGGLTRFWKFIKDPEKIQDLRRKVDEALKLFHLKAAMTTGDAIEKALKGVNLDKLLKSLLTKFRDEIVLKIDRASALNSLPYAQGASWNPALVCQPNTRLALLDSVWDWIQMASSSNSAEIMWLGDVAGSGKSTIAHTVAQRSHKGGLHVSSYFFSPDLPENGPNKLFSTIAWDLATFDHVLGDEISKILETDRALASAPLSRQFEELILNPLSLHPPRKTIVLVIDALDVGLNGRQDIDEELLALLRDQVPRLPSLYRIFITSRPTDTIRSFFLAESHIIPRSIEIDSVENQKDISLYAEAQLKEVARRRKLGGKWPDETLLTDFTESAGGLFQWVFAISKYLHTVVNPDKELKQILSSSAQGLPTEEKMDELYITILNSCNWKDGEFVEGYGLVMGVVITVRKPLSMEALQALLGDTLRVPVDSILGPLGPLLSGILDEHEPIRVLHQSLRDFVTIRAGSASGTARFHLPEAVHSQRLSLLCIELLHKELMDDRIIGVGYLKADDDQNPGIPEVVGVSEVLKYACQFWITQIAEGEAPMSPNILVALQKITSDWLIRWMEILASTGSFTKGLQGIYKSLKLVLPDRYNKLIKPQATALLALSKRLRYTDRRKEALTAVQESVNLRRQLASERPTTFNPRLAESLHNLSTCLSDLGQREEALAAIREAVDLRRSLASERPAVFTSHLASSLHNLSHRLSGLGYREEALAAIQEAVDLRRQLTSEQSNGDLAESLNDLSNHLSDLGHREEALTAIREAVGLRRPLASERPATFNPHLASSLHNLSHHLSSLGHRKEALTAIEDAVNLRRQLALKRPTTFKPDLAESLNNLSNRLSDLSHHKEALAAIREAVKLRRKLASERPAVFNPNLAQSLNNLSNCLSQLHRKEEALAAIQEAVKLRRQLASERPTAFNAHLSESLHNLSNCLSKLSHRKEALAAIKEAVHLRRQLASERPAVFNPHLASSLHNLALRLSSLEHRQEALTAIQEAVKLREQLVEERPVVFAAAYIQSLKFLAKLQPRLDRRAESDDDGDSESDEDDGLDDEDDEDDGDSESGNDESMDDATSERVHSESDSSQSSDSDVLSDVVSGSVDSRRPEIVYDRDGRGRWLIK